MNSDCQNCTAVRVFFVTFAALIILIAIVLLHRRTSLKKPTQVEDTGGMLHLPGGNMR